MYYILITSDSYNNFGTKVSAFDICETRLRENRWPLYKQTGHLRTIKKNDFFLIYVAGKKKNRQHFIGCFECIDIIDRRLKNVDQKILELSNPAPYKEIVFKIKKTKNFLNIRNILDDLEHTKNRKKKWGSLFMGGVKKISFKDYQLVMSYIS